MIPCTGFHFLISEVSLPEVTKNLMLLNPVESDQSNLIWPSVAFGTLSIIPSHLNHHLLLVSRKTIFFWFSSYFFLSIFFAGSSSSTQSLNAAIS